MDLFFMCMRGKQRICVDVGQAAKVENIQEMIQQLLELPERPRLMKPTVITDATTRHNIDKIQWEPMEPSETLTSYKYTKDNALAHEPIPLAFLLPGDEAPFITKLSTPKPIPEDGKSIEGAKPEETAGPSESS